MDPSSCAVVVPAATTWSEPACASNGGATHSVSALTVQSVFIPNKQADGAAQGVQGGLPELDHVPPATHDVGTGHVSGVVVNVPELHVLLSDKQDVPHQPQPDEAQSWQVFDAAHGSGHVPGSAVSDTEHVPTLGTATPPSTIDAWHVRVDPHHEHPDSEPHSAQDATSAQLDSWDSAAPTACDSPPNTASSVNALLITMDEKLRVGVPPVLVVALRLMLRMVPTKRDVFVAVAEDDTLMDVDVSPKSPLMSISKAHPLHNADLKTTSTEYC